MEAQSLDVHDLPARALHLGQRLAETGQVAVREDVTIEELGLARALPVEVVDDPVVEVEPAVLEAGADAPEEGRVVRDPDVLDHADGGDLVVHDVGGQVPVV